jgi:hypothetical protein
MTLEYDAEVYWLYDEEGDLLIYTDKEDELANWLKENTKS